MTATYSTRLILFVVSIMLWISGGTALAQSVPEGEGFGSGGERVSGEVSDVIPIVSIGHSEGQLAHGINFFGQSFTGPTTQSDIQIEAAPTGGNYYYFVVLPGAPSLRFTASTDSPLPTTVFTEFVTSGHTLDYDGSVYTFTSKHGVIAKFHGSGSAIRKLKSIAAPTGETTTYDYVGSELSSIRNNYGYQLKYQLSATPDQVVAINNAVEYCNPTASSCSVGTQWASGTEGSGQTSVTDAAGRVYGINETGSNTTLIYPQTGATISSNFSGGFSTSTTRFGITTSYATINFGTGTLDDNDDTRQVTTTYAGGGSETTVSRTKGGLPTSITDINGQVTTYSYTSGNLVDTISTTRGNSVEYSYDARGNITEIRRKGAVVGGSTAPDLVVTAEYPPDCTYTPQAYCNKPIWTKDAAGNQTNYTYTADGQVAVIDHPSDLTNGRYETHFTYTKLRAKSKTSSGSTVDLDGIMKLTRIERFHGTAQQITTDLRYNHDNLALERVNVIGAGVSSQATYYGYDNFGNRTVVNGPVSGWADRSVTFYDALRRVKGQIGEDPDDAGPMLRPAISYTRNGLGQVTERKTGTATGYTLSSLNTMTVHETQQTFYTSPTFLPSQTVLKDGSTAVSRMEYSYDTQGRLICSALRMDPALTATGNACAAGSPGIYGFDRITKREYDTASRVTRTITGYTTGFSSEQTYAYHAFGPVEYVTDGNGNQSRFTYDSHNRPWQTFYPLATGSGYNPSDYTQVSYDAFGRRSSVRQRDGQTVYFGYDAIGRLKLINAPGTAEDTTSTYDLAGRLTQISKTGSTINYTYDTFGRRLSEASGGDTVSYVYDSLGRRTRMNYPGTDGFYVTYDYYTTGKLKTIRERGTTQLAEYLYDNRGRRSALRRGPASGSTYNNVTTYSYGLLSRLTSLESDIGAGSSTVADQLLSFTYNPAGQIHTQTNSNTIYDPTPATYDNSFGINGLNQIANQDGVAFTHDSAGNLTASPGKAYGYDYANRLTSVTQGGSTATLTYDASSRLSTLVKGSTNYRFYYDGTDMIERRKTTGTLLTRYIHGPGYDEPIAQIEYHGGSPLSYTRTFFTVDARGSVTGQTQGAASVTTNSYDSYGRPDSANSGLYQYTGQIWFDELQLYYYKARFYDPAIRRFLNADPIGYADGMNMYAYVGGDPVNLIDPTGMEQMTFATQSCETTVIQLPDGSIVPGSDIKKCTFAGYITIGEPDYIVPDGIYFDVGGGGGSGSEKTACKTGFQRFVQSTKDNVNIQVEFKAGAAVAAGYRTPFFQIGGRADAFTVHFSHGTEGYRNYITQGGRFSAGALTGEVEFEGASREVGVSPTGGGFNGAPFDAFSSSFEVGKIELSGEVQALVGLGGEFSFDVPKWASDMIGCNPAPKK